MLRSLKSRQKMTAIDGFKNKSVIVTGAGSGIGRAAAIQFAKQGAKVLIADLNEKTAVAVVDEIHALGGIAIAIEALTTLSTTAWSLKSPVIATAIPPNA